MKKTVLFSLFFSISVLVFPQYSAKNFFPRKKIDHEKLSLAVKGGVSLFDGDLGEKSFLPKSDVKFAGGVALAYYFIPQVGVIAEYLHLPYEANMDKFAFSGKINAGTAYLSLNVLNFFSTQRSNRWNLYVNPGVGFSVYNATSTLTPPSSTPHSISNELSLAFPIEVAVEYSLSNSWAIGLGAQYRIHTRDNFEAIQNEQGKYNDGLYIATLSIKYKFQQKRSNSPFSSFCR